MQAFQNQRRFCHPGFGDDQTVAAAVRHTIGSCTLVEVAAERRHKYQQGTHHCKRERGRRPEGPTDTHLGATLPEVAAVEVVVAEVVESRSPDSKNCIKRCQIIGND